MSYLPQVSVITAVLNGEQYLAQCMDSVLVQDYPNVEHVIVDGGSVDHTLQIIDSHKQRVSWFVSEPDQGVYDAFNKGIRQSTGDILWFINSDDYLYHPTVISSIIPYFIDETIQLVYGNVMLRNEQLCTANSVGQPVTLPMLAGGQGINHQSVLCRRALLERHGLFDTQYRYAADQDFIIKCFKECEQNTCYVNLTVAAFRLGGLSSTAASLQEVRQVWQHHFEVPRFAKAVRPKRPSMQYVWAHA